MNSLGIKTGFSTAYHPQTDGQTERTNQVLEVYLRRFCSYYQDNWGKWLDVAEFSLNDLDSTSLGVSPFFFSFSYHPRSNLLTEKTNIGKLDDLLINLQQTQERSIECLTQARAKQAFYYNRKRREGVGYEPGDLVLIQRKFIQPCRINSKLDYCFIGPFKVLGMVGENAVKVDIGREYPKLHPVFNVSLVLRYRKPSDFGRSFMSEGIKDAYYEEQKIVDWSKLGPVLDARLVGKRREYLLRWLHSTPGEDTWVSEEHIPVTFQPYLVKFKEYLSGVKGGRRRQRKKLT